MTRTPTRKLLVGFAAIAVLGAACGSDGDTAGTSTDSATAQSTDGSGVAEADVRIKDFVYDPAEITVAAGSTVTWTNDDFFGHTVTSGEAGAQTDTFDGVLGEVADAQGMGFSFTFDEPGTYPYFCRYHPNMVGTVTVTS